MKALCEFCREAVGTITEDSVQPTQGRLKERRCRQARRQSQRHLCLFMMMMMMMMKLPILPCAEKLEG